MRLSMARSARQRLGGHAKAHSVVRMRHILYLGAGLGL